MSKRVITGFSEFTNGVLDIQAAKAVKALTGNHNFTFADDSFSNFVTAATAYHDSLAALNTGGKAAVIRKNEARAALLPLFSAIAVMVNQQSKGDEAVLLSSGIQLTADRQRRRQSLPLNLKVVNSSNGNMIVSVASSPVRGNGTVFAYTSASNSSNDPNAWTQKVANGHKVTITGLTPGTAYNFTAAYKGRDNDPLIWAPPVNKIVSN
jgi:hypothetical protein